MSSQMVIYHGDIAQSAYKSFIDSDFSPGDIIPKEWFLDQFGIPKPNTAKELAEAQTTYMHAMGRLRGLLLTRNQIALRSRNGIGQEYVHPKDQVQWAMNSAKNGILKEIGKAESRVRNVDISALSDDEKKERSDNMARLSFFATNRISEI